MSKSVRLLILLALFAIAAIASVPAGSQTLYRCGSNYQDRPCEGKDQKEIKITNTSNADAGAKNGVDNQCTARGAAAQKIVWSREGGATMDKMLADAKSPEQKKLVTDVYEKRGTSSEIRAAIEAECVAEKEKAAKLPAPPGTQEQQKQDPPPPGTEKPQNQQSAASAPNPAEEKKRKCDALRNQRESVTNKLRTGGGVYNQESLNQQKRDIDSRISSNQC
jgi:hypothetical protein